MNVIWGTFHSDRVVPDFQTAVYRIFSDLGFFVGPGFGFMGALSRSIPLAYYSQHLPRFCSSFPSVFVVVGWFFFTFFN